MALSDEERERIIEEEKLRVITAQKVRGNQMFSCLGAGCIVLIGVPLFIMLTSACPSH